MTSQFLISIAGALVCYVSFQLTKALYTELTSSLRDLPGPTWKVANFALGHFRETQNDSTLTCKWREEFGTNYQYRGFFNKRDLYTTDTKALNHILANDSLYQKGLVAAKILSDFLGNGLLVVEMDEHKRQRKILNPAFSVAQIRALTEIFVHKAGELRDLWTRQITEDIGSSPIDVSIGLRKMTLDVIGEAGFNYQFNAMKPKDQPDELEQAFIHLFYSPQSQRKEVLRFLQAAVPILNILPMPGWSVVTEARSNMVNIARKLLADSKAAIKAGGGEKTATRRDLLSVMVRANMSTEINDSQKLSDADVIAQIPTFFVAGNETTSVATAWALHALSVNQVVQKKLREELLSIPTDNPTMDELNSLPYLDRVVRETMRVHPPVAFTVRMAMDDDILPLSKQYVDRRGKVYDTIRIQKGTVVRISILGVHSDKEIWGDDAAEFRPDRWERIPEAANTIPGIWGNLLTFLAGQHNCIGFRFAIVEMKALIFTLIRAFEFEAAVPAGGIGSTSISIARPIVLNEREKGIQLPLFVRPYLPSSN
ncbi:cytochrome P450 [Mycena epipterygia]|nr:cytochrome P450 [Mycena epipterygia]